MKLVYDITSLPKGMTPVNLVKILENHKVVFWDSSLGTKPKFYAGNDIKDEAEVLLVDTSGKELDIAFYEQEHKEKEFWEKELYNCNNSPIHFFKNYGTPVWPHTDEGIRNFLKELGLVDISVTDSADAQEAWKIQKAKLKEGLKHVTIDFLKERATVISVLKTEYQERVAALEEKLKDAVRLVDSNNVPLEPKKQISNLAEKIRSVLPVHSKYSDKYRTKKGKWDTPMLYNTDYAFLLQMLDDVLTDKNS